MAFFPAQIDSFILFLATERGLSENYQISTRISLEGFADWVGQNRGVLETSGVKLEHLTDYLAVRKGDGLSAASLRLIIIALKIFFRFLQGRKAIEDDVTEALIAPKMEKYLPETLNEKEIELLLESIRPTKLLGKRDRAILELLYASGLRISELTNSTLDNLDLDEGFIRVTGKGNKTRIVPVGKRALSALTIYIETERKELVKPGKTGMHIFLSVRGGKLTTARAWQIVKERTAMAGLEVNVYPHLFRHSFATHLLGNGADLRIIQELLGHADISTTQIYTHVDQKRLKKVHRQFHPRG